MLSLSLSTRSFIRGARTVHGATINNASPVVYEGIEFGTSERLGPQGRRKCVVARVIVYQEREHITGHCKTIIFKFPEIDAVCEYVYCPSVGLV